jgi:pentachlorophenol monooxygenase
VTLSGPLPGDESHRFLSGKQALVVWPIRGKGRFFLTGPEGVVKRTAARAAPTLAEMQAFVDARTPDRLTLSEPRWLARYRVHRRLAKSYGRVFLAGNAGHVHSTTGAQGMNTGIQDAYNLAWKLALVATGSAPVSLLDSYEVERRPVALEVLETSERVFGNESPDPDKARRRIVGMLSQLDVSYRGSPVVAEAVNGNASGGPRAGDRAPDGLLEPRKPREARRLFGILSHTRHSLLVFAGSDAAVDDEPLQSEAVRVVESYRGLVDAYRIAPAARVGGSARIPTAHDADGVLHETYGASKPALYLIRPDGYVGFRSGAGAISALEPYLARVLRR